MVFSDPEKRRKCDELEANWNHSEWYAILTKVAKAWFIRRIGE
jgi:hypothetical protein